MNSAENVIGNDGKEVNLLIRHLEWTQRNPWYPLLVSLMAFVLSVISLITE